MRISLAILIAVLLLASCGQASAPKDPFVGTWRVIGPPGPQAHLVIAKTQDGYESYLFVPPSPRSVGWLGPYTRNGNELKARLHITDNGKPTGQVIVELIHFLPATGHLTYKDGTGPAIEFSRVSTSTAIPTPLPS